MMYKNKRAMSAIVTMLIIVALSLVAIGAVWYVIQNLLSTTEGEVTQGSDDLFDNCATSDIAFENGTIKSTGVLCASPKEIRTVGREYCCIV